MRKKFDICNVDCSNCAANMEAGIKKIDGVADAKLNFLSQKLIIEAEENDFDRILKLADECIKKIDDEAYIEI